MQEKKGLQDLKGVRGETPDVSIIIPVFNEAANLTPLHAKLIDSLGHLTHSYEIIFIDDGSSDESLSVLRNLASLGYNIRVIVLRRHFGQTAAMSAGIDHSRGEILISMDADLQNDPDDISRLLEKVAEGYDVVSGWRKDRKDSWLTRRLPSIIANGLISRITGVPLHDCGCTLKAYRREVLEDIKLYGDMHRYIPIFASWAGARVTEIPVKHSLRVRGESKYGLSRTIKVLFDLLTVSFLSRFHTKPLHLFGSAGLACLIVSLISFGGISLTGVTTRYSVLRNGGVPENS